MVQVKRAQCALAFVLATVVVGPARADSSADEAEARFRRGAELYKQGRYQEALLEFFTSNRLSPNRNVVFNIARSYEALARFDEAYHYYDAYRSAESSPSERAVAERKLGELAPRVALLSVTTEPPGATVYIDRKDLGGHGETPIAMALPPGPHKVIVEKEGFEPAEAAATVARGQRVETRRTLDPIVGRVRIVARPDAEVRVDRAEDDAALPDLPSTPATLALTPGRHSLELRAPGHRPLRRLLLVAAHDEQVVDAALEPLPSPSGTLALTASERGAAVSIDGRASGVTPLVSALPVGRHRLRVTLDGYEPWEREVVVAKDSHELVEAELAVHEAEVVAVTRVAQRVGAAPASVSLVATEELAAFGYETLADALRAVRGLYVSDDRNYPAVGIRGFSRPGDYTNRVLVLRDGHVYNDDLVGSGFVGREFAPDLSDVSRVEVVRGPGSAFYGQGAFFGVVNVVSLPAGAGPALSAGGAILSDGGSRARARAAVRLGDDTGLTLGVQAYGSTGQTLYFDELKDTPSGGYARDTDGENAQRAALRLQSGRFSVDASYNRRQKQVPTATFGTIFDPAHFDGLGGTVEETLDERGTLDARWDNDTLLLRAYADYAAYHGCYPYDDTVRGKFVLHDAGRGLALGGEARVTLVAPSWQRLELGIEAARHDVQLTVDTLGTGHDDFDDGRAPVVAALYAVDELTLGRAATVTVGARVDRLAISNELLFSPRLAAVLRPYAAGRTKLVLGQSYRAPSDYEQYYSDNGLTQIPAPPLDPETIDTAEAEHEHQLGRGTYVLASVFASRIRRLIGLVEDPVAKKLVYANSGSEARSFGGEVELRTTWDSGATLLGAVSVTDLSGGDPLVRTNSPPVTAFVKGLWPAAKDVTLAAEVVYNAPRRERDGGETEHMLLGNVIVSGWLLGHHLRWQMAVYNVLDWRYSVAVGDEFVQQAIRQDGRRFQAGLGYEY